MKMPKAATFKKLGLVIIVLAVLVGGTTLYFLNNIVAEAIKAEDSLVQLTMIKDFKASLLMAAETYTAMHTKSPSNFLDYVSQAAPPRKGNYTITIYGFGYRAPCMVSDTTITCQDTFWRYPFVTYTYHHGNITGTATSNAGKTITF
jgi:hypothetical protein